MWVTRYKKYNMMYDLTMQSAMRCVWREDYMK
jgi:hypothetical protein